MFNLGPEKLLVIAVVALVVLGPNRLPEAARKVGKVVRDLRELSSRVQTEVQQAFEEHTGATAVEAVDTLRSITGGPLGPARSGLNAALAAVSTQTTQPRVDGEPDVASTASKKRPSPAKKPGPVRKKAPTSSHVPAATAAKRAAPKSGATAKKAPAARPANGNPVAGS